MLCGKCKKEERSPKHAWCKGCNRAYGAAYYLATAEKQKARTAAWQKANPEKVKSYNAKQDKHANRIRSQQYRDANRLKVRAANALYRLQNPHKRAAKEANRRASRGKATPKWANRFFMEEAYDLAQRRTLATGIKWNVDHIVPICSKIVCGLHTHTNIRVIPETLNSSKGNRVWPLMP